MPISYKKSGRLTFLQNLVKFQKQLFFSGMYYYRMFFFAPDLNVGFT